MKNTPVFVYRNSMIADMSFVEWLSELKQRFQKSQVKAAIRVNTAMLEFYWSLGRDMNSLRAESKWGSGFYNQLSLDLKEMFPEQTGFSVTNLKYMKRWYSFYNEMLTNRQRPIDENRHQVGDEIRQQAADELNPNRQQAADELEMPEQFGEIPWFHHVEIFTHSQSIEEALFYLNQVANEGWSRGRLEDEIKRGLYEAKGAAVSNFSTTLPALQSSLAQEILKDPYHFEFLALKPKYDERDLEEA